MFEDENRKDAAVEICRSGPSNRNYKYGGSIIRDKALDNLFLYTALPRRRKGFFRRISFMA
jgi:hypothetical protein